MTMKSACLGVLLAGLGGCLLTASEPDIKGEPTCFSEDCDNGFACEDDWGECLDSCEGDDECQEGFSCCLPNLHCGNVQPHVCECEAMTEYLCVLGTGLGGTQ